MQVCVSGQSVGSTSSADFVQRRCNEYDAERSGARSIAAAQRAPLPVPEEALSGANVKKFSSFEHAHSS